MRQLFRQYCNGCGYCVWHLQYSIWSCQYLICSCQYLIWSSLYSIWPCEDRVLFLQRIPAFLNDFFCFFSSLSPRLCGASDITKSIPPPPFLALNRTLFWHQSRAFFVVGTATPNRPTSESVGWRPLLWVPEATLDAGGANVTPVPDAGGAKSHSRF